MAANFKPILFENIICGVNQMELTPVRKNEKNLSWTFQNFILI